MYTLKLKYTKNPTYRTGARSANDAGIFITGETMNTKKGFDYSELSPADRMLAQSCANEIKDFVRKSTRDAHRIGVMLLEVKRRLEHGRFLAWLKAELGASADTAERLMKVAKRLPQIPHAAEIGLTAMYMLAANGVSEAARDEAIARAGGGEPITTSKAREIVARHREGEPSADDTTYPTAADRGDAKAGSLNNDSVTAAPQHKAGSPPGQPERPVAEEDDGEATPARAERRTADDDFHALVAALVERRMLATEGAADTVVASVTRGWSRNHKAEVAERAERAAGVLHHLAGRLRRRDKAAVQK